MAAESYLRIKLETPLMPASVQSFMDSCGAVNGYFGRTVKSYSSTGLRFTESAYEAGQHLPTHEHAAATMCLVLEGAFDERWGGSDVEFSKDMLLYRPSGHVHSDRFSAPITLTLSIDLSDELAEAGPGVPTSIKGPTARNIAIRLGRELRNESDPLVVESLTHLLHDELARIPGDTEARPPRWLKTVCHRLEDDMRRTPSLTELAEIANVHPMHLTRRFNRFFGCSIGEYARNIRIERSRRLLAESDLSIGEISLDVGFCDQAHFTRVFRNAVGCPPAEYRRRVNR